MRKSASFPLFACASGGEQVFLDVLQHYFDGNQDDRTLKLLDWPASGEEQGKKAKNSP